MKSVSLASPADAAGFLHAAAGMLASETPPDEVVFVADGQGDLFADLPVCEEHTQPPAASNNDFSPRVRAMVRLVSRHTESHRYALLYRLLWRLRTEPRLLDNGADRHVRSAARLARAVRRDAHKMKAFVRFRRVDDERDGVYLSWFEPEHHIVDAVAPFFARRFTGMQWSILTPRRCAHWDGSSLVYSAGVGRAQVPDGDALEALWLTYYSNIFNPARINTRAMQAEMPKKYWRNLPEARAIPALLQDARQSHAALAPAVSPSITTLAVPADRAARLTYIARELETCRRCPIGATATRAVPGVGPLTARLAIVGEQPGDMEDREGTPFVGPAGRELDAALDRADVPRAAVYVTNAVKHFKFRRRGKRRLHESPSAAEIEHCRWWLNLELGAVEPEVVVALGASAARALMGQRVAVSEVRGQLVESANGRAMVVTHHPAAILRALEEHRARLRDEFVADLRLAARGRE